MKNLRKATRNSWSQRQLNQQKILEDISFPMFKIICKVRGIQMHLHEKYLIFYSIQTVDS